MTHLPDHAIEAVDIVEDVEVPSPLGRTPRYAMFTAQPELHLLPHHPIHLVEHPIAVADPEVRAPAVQDRVELPDEIDQAMFACDRAHSLAHLQGYRLYRLASRPEVKMPFTDAETEAQELEPVASRRQTALFSVQLDRETVELAFQLSQGSLSLPLRADQQHHVVRVTNKARSTGPADPLPVHLMQVDVGQQRRYDPALRRTADGMAQLAGLHHSRFEPSPDQA